MAARRGSELLIKRSDGADTFTTIGALQSASLNLNGNPIDVTTGDDVDENNEIWRSNITGVKDLSVSGNGIGKAAEPIQSMYGDFATGTITTYQIIVPHVGTFEVPMVVTSMTFDGPYDGAATFSLEMQSAGAPTFTAEAAT